MLKEQQDKQQKHEKQNTNKQTEEENEENGEDHGLKDVSFYCDGIARVIIPIIRTLYRPPQRALEAA